MGSLSKPLRALFLGVALVASMVAGTSFFMLSELRRPAGEDTTPVEFVVEPGDATSTISSKLAAEGLIRQPLLFNTLVRMQGFDGDLQAGSYVLRPSMTMSEVIATLRESPQVTEVQVQVIEGLRLEEIAEVIGNSDLRNVTADAFLNAARDGGAFQERYFVLNSLPEGASLEGYLFPDTYRLEATATVTDVIDVMLARFADQYATFETSVSVDASVHQIVTMASIVQREAALAGEMPQISAVFWNRLKPERLGEFGGGLLGADPTVQYVLGQPGSWWPQLNTLTAEQINGAGAGTPLAAYNTRQTPGLPPGPISTPGLQALQAAAQPDATAEYAYFVAACDRPGAHNFAVTNEEFLRFQEEYLACQ